MSKELKPAFLNSMETSVLCRLIICNKLCEVHLKLIYTVSQFSVLQHKHIQKKAATSPL